MGVERDRYKPPVQSGFPSYKVGVRHYLCSVVQMPCTGKEAFVFPPSFMSQADFVSPPLQSGVLGRYVDREHPRHRFQPRAKMSTLH